jgi:hypothetical protein
MDFSLGLIIAVIVCGLAANHLSGGMAARVRAQSGRKHVPVLLNFKLAQSYRELFGSNGTYWQFVIVNLVYLLGLLIVGILALISWLRG